MNTSWTSERIELLTALWADGIPAGEIAKRLGGGITRGMVAGKRFKLGLPPRTGRIGKLAMAANARRTSSLLHSRKVTALGADSFLTPESVEAVAAEARRKAALATLAAEELAIQPLRGSNPKPWELRGRRECAFPVAGCGSTVLSCCEPIEGRGPYCYAHRELSAGRPWPPEDPAAHNGSASLRHSPPLDPPASLVASSGAQNPSASLQGSPPRSGVLVEG